MITGSDAVSQSFYQLGLCFPSQAFTEGYLDELNSSRSAQVKFFTHQKFRNGTVNRIEYDGERMNTANGADYFGIGYDVGTSGLSYDNCLKMPDGVRIPIIGSP